MNRRDLHVQYDVSNPGCEPFHLLEMSFADLELKAVFVGECLEALHGGVAPGIDVFLFHVHVDVEHTTCGFECQQPAFPYRF